MRNECRLCNAPPHLHNLQLPNGHDETCVLERALTDAQPRFVRQGGGAQDAAKSVLALTKQGWVTYEIKHEHGYHDDWCNACRALDKREVR